MNEVCVDDYESKITQWAVAFGVVNVTYEEVDIYQLSADFSEISSIQSSDMDIELETDDEGDVLNFVVTVTNKTAAYSLNNTVMSLDKGVNCEYGVICQIESSVFLEPHSPQSLSSASSSLVSPSSPASSSASSIHVIKGIMMILFIILMMMMMIY